MSETPRPCLRQLCINAYMKYLEKPKNAQPKTLREQYEKQILEAFEEKGEFEITFRTLANCEDYSDREEAKTQKEDISEFLKWITAEGLISSLAFFRLANSDYSDTKITLRL